jgi:hypothetical protein
VLTGEYTGYVCNTSCHFRISNQSRQGEKTGGFLWIDFGWLGGQGGLRLKKIECDEQERG